MDMKNCSRLLSPGWLSSMFSMCFWREYSMEGCMGCVGVAYMRCCTISSMLSLVIMFCSRLVVCSSL